MTHYEEDDYLVVPVIPVEEEDDILHTAACPFCQNASCGCHEDPTLLAEVEQAYQDGLLTPDEATGLTLGKAI
jgi:hypothetical protein